jgi:rubrerythrin
MNVFDYAMQMEKDGEAYYRDLADKCKIEGLKMILLLLADDEVGHYKAFKRLKGELSPEVIETIVLTNAKTIFAEMKETLTDDPADMSEVELYKKAIEVERKSAAFYTEKAGEVENTEAKEAFLKIAGDELKHQHLLENMVEFLSRPKTWVEAAEFVHLDEY